MSFPLWSELIDYFCAQESVRTPATSTPNPFYEEMANRRYNYSPASDRAAFRLVFLKEVLQQKGNNTLRRNGRFIWCKNLRYEGRNNDGWRQISFTVDNGQKRFTASENNILCVPSKVFVNNNRYFRQKEKTFSSFSSVFGYKNSFNMMAKNSGCSKKEFEKIVTSDSPFKPGTLVAPRLGYFYPQMSGHDHTTTDTTQQHPCGIILGPSFIDNYIGQEFYRVRFGSTTYERVHPIQMEIINEV